MPQPAQRSSTLVATEAAWDPAIRLLAFACMASSALLLGLSRGADGTAWPPLVLASLVLHASNLRYLLTHRRATVGMGPVALFALLPAVASCVGMALPAPLSVLCLTSTLALASLLAFFLWWFVRLRRAFSGRPSISPTAALIVLGANVTEGRPGTTLARRLEVAARLWHEQPERTVVVTGGATPDGSTTEAAVMARCLRELGVPDDSLLLEPTARNTSENVRLSCVLLDARGFAGQRCVVSSDYHLFRVLREAAALGVTLTPVPAPTPRSSALQQWCREVLTLLAVR